MGRRGWWRVSAAVLASFLASARGDIVHKNDGGKVTGTVILEESDAETLVIKTKYGKIPLKRSDVREVIAEAASTESYADAVKRFPDTADGQWALALWCQAHHHPKEAQHHLRRVIELDPDHAEARRRLSYRRQGNEWVTRDQWQKSQGLVKHGNSYVLPQEKARFEQSARDREIQQELWRTIKLWKRQLHEDRPDKRRAALSELQALTDPLAVKPLIQELGERGGDDDRALLVRILKGIDDPSATSGLVLVALGDRVDANRAAANLALASRKSPSLLAALSAQLKSPDNDRINRVADTLASMKDPSVVPALVDALVTRHQTVREPSFIDKMKTLSGHSTQFNTTTVLPNGVIVQEPIVIGPQSGVFGVAPQAQTQVIVEDKANPSVLAALAALTGEQFGYDRRRWLTWMASNDERRASSPSNGP